MTPTQKAELARIITKAERTHGYISIAETMELAARAKDILTENAELEKALAEMQAQADEVFEAPDGRKYSNVCAFNHWALTRNREQVSLEFTNFRNAANAKIEALTADLAVDRDKLVYLHALFGWEDIWEYLKKPNPGSELLAEHAAKLAEATAQVAVLTADRDQWKRVGEYENRRAVMAEHALRCADIVTADQVPAITIKGEP